MTTTAALTDADGADIAWSFTFDGSGAVSISTDDAAIVHDNLMMDFRILTGADGADGQPHQLVEIATASGTSGLSGGTTDTPEIAMVVDIAGTTLLDANAATDDEVLIYDTSGNGFLFKPMNTPSLASLLASCG